MKDHTKTRILFTGGHVTPAYAVIEALQEKGYSKLYYVGRKYSDRAQKDISFEFNEISKLNIPFYHLTTGRLSRNIGIHTFYDLFAVLYGFITSLLLLNKIKPKVIVSFGGYIALPLSIVGWLLGIQIITHEQTISPGISNRIIGTIASQVLVSFEDTSAYFGSHKTIHTGNPIRSALLQKGKKVMDTSIKKPFLFITGGSLGSHSINIHIEEILPALLQRYAVLHQVGNASEFQDYERLKEHTSQDYHVVRNLSVDEMAWAYHKSDVIVARSGANTLWELLMLKKPAVLVPLPWSGRNEQRLQANFFVNFRLGQEYDQIEPSSVLFKKINEVYENRIAYQKAFEKLPPSFILPAAQRIAAIIATCVS